MAVWKNVRVLAAVSVVAALLAVALWPDPTQVDLTRAVRGPMQVTIDEDGETRVRERFVVSAPVTGRLQRVRLEPGDRVERGTTVLARLLPSASPLLDPRTRSELAAAADAARSAAGQAEAERDRTAATLELARATFRRQESLATAGAISRETLKSSETALKTAESALRAAEFAVLRAQQEVQLARARLQSPGTAGGVVEVVAPVDGVVLKRLRESESVVPVGEPLIEIGEPQDLEIVADLLSTDAVRVSAGNRVLIEQWGGTDALDGSVRRVEPSGFMKVSALGVEEQRVNVSVDLAQPGMAARALGDGYRVEVRIVVWQEADVVRVAVGSLFRRGSDWAVFVVDDGRARLQVVQLGQRNSDEGQIVAGLEAGQAVVLHPPDTLADGMRVAERRR